MHIYYGKYLEKAKNEIDTLVRKEVDGGALDRTSERDLKTLLYNYDGICELLKAETEGSESDIPASRA